MLFLHAQFILRNLNDHHRNSTCESDRRQLYLQRHSILHAFFIERDKRSIESFKKLEIN